jgi:hypothetical protein
VELLVRYAPVLTDLAARHGLTNLHRAGTGRLVADVNAGRTHLDVASFELDAEGLLRARLDVVLSDWACPISSDGEP